MFRILKTRPLWTACLGAALLLVTLGPLPAPAEEPQGHHPGQINLDLEGLPPATVAVDLSRGMLTAVAGLARGALAGSLDALSQYRDGQSAPAAQSAEHLAVMEQILATLSSVLGEVRVRVYEDLPPDTQAAQQALADHVERHLGDQGWDRVVRVREGDESVQVSILREEEAIRGLLVMVSEGNELVVVNVACDLTPDKVKEVTHQATGIGLKFGLEQALEEALKQLPPARR